MNKKHTHTLTFRIIAGMALGLLLGILLNSIGVSGWVDTWLVNGILDVGGRIFISLLKLLVVPLVFVSLVVGTASLEDVGKVGRLGVKTLALYLSTTAIAIILAISMGVLVQPGKGLDLVANQTYEPKAAPPLSDIFVNIIPSNPIRALADGEMLQIIFFAIFFGIALAMSKKKGERLLHLFQDLDHIIMQMVMILIQFAPYGVFFLIAKVFAQQGFSAVLPLAKYFFLTLAVLILHWLVVYPTLLKLIAGLNPFTFFRKFKGVPVFAFSTSSSNATIPVTLENVITKLGVSNSVASFTVPLGATINMDGTAIMQGVATVFIAQVYNVDISLSGYAMVVITATLASIGTAGVPGVGLITLAMVLRQVNLPVEGIALIIGVDRLLDMARTVVNVTGDATVSCIVAKSEGQIDLGIYNSPIKSSDTETV
ncbi:MAG: dicarboxylate/amino acid:cation symporter [Bdellovibrio sp. CG10_big_fil_rev_8_21_14_0_10_47_8]|nr:MAG: dicarboxylate/amino acid:cation symporter [Bdellovibrio sp. CG10_big_fil_rev_8_21_14_0_10_47_8]